MLASQKALHPRYAEKFQCIGSACEDTCCSSWQIPIDRKTFDKYRALPKGPLTPVFEANLVVRIHPADAPAPPNTDSFYGQITLLPDATCPFLSSENLCRIQTELGKDHLSQVCANFPRVTRQIDSRPETSLLLSCPEAARQVLLDRRFMRMPGTAPHGHARYTPFLGMAASLDPPHGNPLQYLMEIRHFHMLVLKDRSYPLWQRLFIIGLFSKRLTKLLNGASGSRDTVPMLLRSYAELMQQGRLRSTMDAVPAQPETQLSIILKLLDARGAIGPIPQRLLECFQAFMAGVKFDPKLSLKDITPSYHVAYTDQFQPFLARNPQMLENYLLSYILRNRFPFGDDLVANPTPTTPQQEFALMALRYSVINALAAGMAGHYGDAFNAEHVVQLVQSFSKSFEHNLAIRETMLDLIAEHGLTDSTGIAMLLRV